MKWFYLILMIALVACSTQKAQEGIQGQILESIAKPVKEFNVIAKQFEFIPNKIEVNQNDDVIIHLSSADVTHGFRISEYNINQQVSAGKDQTIRFVANKAGTFPFSCSIPCGQGHTKMQGELIVRTTVQG